MEPPYILPMFHFATPAYLLLLLVLPLLAWRHLRQRRLGVPHPGLALFAGLPVGRARVAQFGGLFLRLLSLGLLALALAGPRWPDLRTRLDTEGIALMMVVDVSGSMAETDFDWNGESISRLEAVKRVFRLFVAGTASGERLPDGSNERFEGRATDFVVGLVTFATRPEVACPLTLSHSTVLMVLMAEEAHATRRADRKPTSATRSTVALAPAPGRRPPPQGHGAADRRRAQRPPDALRLGAKAVGSDRRQPGSSGAHLHHQRRQRGSDARGQWHCRFGQPSPERANAARTWPTSPAAAISRPETRPRLDRRLPSHRSPGANHHRELPVSLSLIMKRTRGWDWLRSSPSCWLWRWSELSGGGCRNVVGPASRAGPCPKPHLIGSCVRSRGGTRVRGSRGTYWQNLPESIVYHPFTHPLMLARSLGPAGAERARLVRGPTAAARPGGPGRSGAGRGAAAPPIIAVARGDPVAGVGLPRPRHGRSSLGTRLESVGRSWTRPRMVVVDLSRSMYAESPSRVELARSALFDLGEDAQATANGHRVGLVVFAGRARLVCPLTHDIDHFRDRVTAIDTLFPDPDLGSGGLRIGAPAPALAVASLSGEGRSRAAQDILLLSDGDDPARDGEWTIGIDRAQAEGFAVHCIAIGDTAHGHRIPTGSGWLSHDGNRVRTRREDAPLREIARRTKGQLIEAGTQPLLLGEHYLEAGGSRQRG